MDKWRDIETAPMDGTVIWVTNSQMNEPVLAQFGLYRGKPAWVLVSDPDPYMPTPPGALVIPDRWQPLTAPPETVMSDKWRDMGDAPKEGVFLVYLEEEMCGSRVHAMRRSNITTIGTLFVWDAPKPIAWQPLPSPPENENG